VIRNQAATKVLIQTRLVVRWTQSFPRIRMRPFYAVIV
jgi:hypothetical protein